MNAVAASIAIAGGVAFLAYAVKITRARPSDIPLAEKMAGAVGLIIIGRAALFV